MSTENRGGLNMSNLIQGRAVGATVPGLYELTAPATDEDGETYPAGTRYMLSAAGYDNVRNAEYQTVRIDGRDVTFTR